MVETIILHVGDQEGEIYHRRILTLAWNLLKFSGINWELIPIIGNLLKEFVESSIYIVFKVRFCLLLLANCCVLPTRYPDNIYLFKVNNRSTRKRCEICSKLTIEIPERRQWRLSGIFIVNFENISHLLLVFLLLTLNK